jgi:alpha-tubulin suppressor-like RCC1 family protein
VSIKEGVHFSSCAAGQQHTAAATDGGLVFVFGSNDKGQLGCDTSTQAPVAVHVLSAPALPARSSTRGQPAAHAQPPVPAAAAGYSKSDSLEQLANAMKLPPSLTASLAQQRHLEQQAATEQQQLLLAELLSQQQLGQQQQLASAKRTGCQPAAACAAAHVAVAAGISHGTRSTQQLPQQQEQQQQQQVLCVYRLNLGAAVCCIACGSHHTLAALASSGLVSQCWPRAQIPLSRAQQAHTKQGSLPNRALFSR